MTANHVIFACVLHIMDLVCSAQYQPVPLKSANLSPSNTVSENGASVSLLNSDVSTTDEWIVTTSTQIGWNLLLSLDETWGFYSGGESTLQITINGDSLTSALDLVLSFSVNDADFFTVFLSMDNSVNNRLSPSCNIDPNPSSTNVNQGNITEIVNTDTGYDRWYKSSLSLTWGGMRNGQKVNGYDNAWPLQFTLRNVPDMYGDDLFLSFTTPSWLPWSQNCGFSSFDTDLGLQMFIGSNNIGEQFVISSIVIEYGYPLTYPPTRAQLIELNTTDTRSPTTTTQTLTPTSTPTPTPTQTPTTTPTSTSTLLPTDTSLMTTAPTSYTILPASSSVNTQSPTNSPLNTVSIQPLSIYSTNAQPTKTQLHDGSVGNDDNIYPDQYNPTDSSVNDKNEMTKYYLIIGVVVPLNCIACGIIIFCVWIRKKQKRLVDIENTIRMAAGPGSNIYGDNINMTSKDTTQSPYFQSTKTMMTLDDEVVLSETEGYRKTDEINIELASQESDYAVGIAGIEDIVVTPKDNVDNVDNDKNGSYIDDNIGRTPGNDECIVSLQRDEFIIDEEDDFSGDMGITFETQTNDIIL